LPGESLPFPLFAGRVAGLACDSMQETRRADFVAAFLIEQPGKV
jgi:hypothetical protein